MAEFKRPQWSACRHCRWGLDHVMIVIYRPTVQTLYKDGMDLTPAIEWGITLCKV